MITRRGFISAAAVSGVLPHNLSAEVAAIPEPHFPTRLHQYVWRNWELANLDRMAAVLHTDAGKLRRIGESMGLPSKPQLSEDQLRRIYITTIRQNWHLLPNDQLIELLGWTREKFEFTLKEDDFLDVKLGPKPQCEPVTYSEPSQADSRRAAQMRRLMKSSLGSISSQAGEPAFDFVSRLSSLEVKPQRNPDAKPLQNSLDLSSCSVHSGEGVDPRIAARLTEYLRAAFGVRANGNATIDLAISPDIAKGFAADVSDSAVRLTANAPDTLLQAIYWLQDEMELTAGPWLRRGQTERKLVWDPRHLYSYFALYGDPLVEPEIDPFPDGYLEKLARAGVNGVWMQCVLNNMAPSKVFPEFGNRAEERLTNLNRLIERAKRYGIQILLYLNEPRAMPASFFRDRPEIRGAESQGLYAMCTTPAIVRDWISDSLAHVFKRCPELGGVFTITMSENLTNCFSKSHPERCPRCRNRKSWDVVGEVVEAVRSGVRRSSKTAHVISWDWGWPEDMCLNLIPKLPKDIRYQSVSEWSMPIERGGVKTVIGEYSISVVGPGPRATANWGLARKAGLRTMAKTQFNNTWEISAVPYIPVAPLIARHCDRLARAGVSGIQASWTLGGYPSPNLEVAKEFYYSPPPDPNAVLRRVAERRYGKDAAPEVVKAWTGFSEAFELYPYSVHIYLIPTQHGPANLLRMRPTGVRGTMILFPQDDYKAWAGKYTPAVAQREFTRMADRWEQAMPGFRNALRAVSRSRSRQALEDLAIAETCYIHFRSTANQFEFYQLRDAPRTAESTARMRELVRAEMDLAQRLYPLAQQHSVIAFEASNHYYYRPSDLAEKILNCQYILDRELKESSKNG